MLALKLSTKTFMYEEVKHLSTFVMLYDGETCINAFHVPRYAVSEDDLFEVAMNAVDIAGSIQSLLEKVGKPTELDEALKMPTACATELRRQYAISDN